MSTQEQARALMMRRQHSNKNRQQTMLNRAAAEIGLNLDLPVSAAQPTKKQ
jgi:hypothetical protein